MKRIRRRVTAAGDIHFPWGNDHVLAQFYKRLHTFQPEAVIQVGDLMDMYSFARFARSFNVYTPQQELAIARKKGEVFWQTVRDICPRAKRFQLVGNHEDRAVKLALNEAPELEEFVRAGIHKLMEFPGVKTIHDSREVFMIDDVGYHHGYLLQPGAHARSFNCNMVTGHTHFGCVIPVMTEKELFWELNAGYIGDRFAKAMSYTAQRKFSKWTVGWGEIDEVGPRFVPAKESP